MTARNQDIGVYRGDTATLTISLTAADGSAYDPSVEVDIEWRMSPMRHTDEADALVRKSLADGIVIVPGGVEITLSAIDTDFEPGVYYQEMKVVDAGDVSTTMIGAVVIKPALRMTASTHRSPPAISATPRSSSLPSQPPAVLRGLGRARACNRGRPYRADHQRRRQARPCQPAKPMQGMPTGQDRRRALRLDVDSAEVSRLRH